MPRVEWHSPLMLQNHGVNTKNLRVSVYDTEQEHAVYYVQSNVTLARVKEDLHIFFVFVLTHLVDQMSGIVLHQEISDKVNQAVFQ